jgi:hypothetical protein
VIRPRTARTGSWSGHVSLSGPGDHPLLLRSDGSRWWRVISPSMPDGGILSAVSTQPDGNAWAVGNACTPCKTLILRWDGSAWRRVNSPSFGGYAQLLDISTTLTSGWASGWYSCTRRCSQPGVDAPTLILRWDGSAWRRVNSPSLGQLNVLNAISGVAGGTAWAGELSCAAPCGSPPAFRSAILRWNGSDWSRVPSPAGNWQLNGIVAQPGGGAVAVGHARLPGCGSASEVDCTVILRRSGSRWSVVR